MRPDPYDGAMRRLSIAAAADAALIILFAALGRRTHDEGSAVGGTLVVAAPFLIGYAVAAAVLRLDRAPFSVRRAAPVWAAGIGLGMLLRGTVFDRGLAPAFVVVAFVTTGALLLGWRLVVARLAATSADPAA
jgi:hypothetical protein